MVEQLDYIERKQLTHLIMLAGNDYRLEISTWVNTEFKVATVWVKLVSFAPLATFPDVEIDLEQLLETAYFIAPDESYRSALGLRLNCGASLMEWLRDNATALKALAQSHLDSALAENAVRHTADNCVFSH